MGCTWCIPSRDAHPHPRRPQQGRPGGHHAASGMGGPPPRCGPGPLPPLHPPSPPPMAPGHPPPCLGHRRPFPTPPTLHQKGEGQGQGKGMGHQGAVRQEGTEGPQVRAGTHRDRAPEETPHGGGKPPKKQEGAGAGTKARRKRAPRQTPRPTPRKGIPRGGDQRRPTPIERRTTPGGAPPNAHRRSKHQTSAHPPATGNHTGNGGHTHTGRTGHTRRGSRRERRRTAHHHALTARRRPRPPQGPPHRHRKRTKAQPQRPGLGTGTPRGHGTKAQAPREGNPMDAYPTHQPKRHA